MNGSDEDKQEITGQVSPPISRVGSCSSLVQTSESVRRKNKLRLQIAKLKEEQVKKENDVRLLEAQTETLLVKLDCSSDDEDLPCTVAKPDACCQPEESVVFSAGCCPARNHQSPYVSSQSLASAKPLLASEGLPNVELQPFDGEPSSYWRFIRQFEEYVDRRVQDDGQRYLYLQHYCRGLAKQAVEGCVILPRHLAYKEARRVLESLFGQPHRLAKTLLDEVINGPSIQGNPEDLLQLAIKMYNCQISLTQLDHLGDLNSMHTLEAVVRRLPARLQHEWARHADGIECRSCEPGFSDLRQFVEGQARIGSSRFGRIASQAGRDTQFSSRRVSLTKGMKNVVLRTEATQPKANKTVVAQGPPCIACLGSHSLTTCPTFNQMSVQDRWNFLRKNSCCFTCLNPQHIAKNCSHLKQCGVGNCRRWHHELLHQQLDAVEGVVNVSCVTVSGNESLTMLGIVPVRLLSPRGSVVVYALLDDGSNRTLIDETLIEELNLDSTECSTIIRTVSGAARGKCRATKLQIQSTEGEEVIEVEQALSLPRFSFQCPDLNPEILKQWPHLRDVHVSPRINAQVKLLIGLDVPEAHWIYDQRVGGRNDPYAVRTLLGWAIRGRFTKAVHVGQMASTFHVRDCEEEIVEQLKRLYESDFTDVASAEFGRSVDDCAAYDIVANGCSFSDGHFTIPLPWKLKPCTLPNNRLVAEHRLFNLKKRLFRDPELRKQYAFAIREMLIKGYASRAVADDNSLSCTRWYLPHHAVFHPRKPGKVRVVMDCAAQFRGKSLNSALYQGPDTTAELVTVLLRFRKGTIAVNADIKEMFMQIRVTEMDRDALRFLWWNNDECEGEASEFQMLVHPFGATSSPFCATYALRRSIETFGPPFPSNISQAVLENFYVDDCLMSMDSESEASHFVSQIRELLSRAGFKLTKWISNNKLVLKDIPIEDQLTEPSGRELLRTMTLGIKWDSTEDCFCFQLGFEMKVCTRRKLLSALASIYDPLGLIAPIVFPGKVILQSLCKAGVSWDEPLADEFDFMLHKWSLSLASWGELRIPRCFRKGHDELTSQSRLHVFCDASEQGYGAVAYLQFHGGWSLVCAKCRVAPIKFVTIPRLELAAAVLGVKLHQTVTRALGFERSETIFWTDSMIVLHYIKNTSKRFATYIANRVSFIHNSSSSDQWVYVNSAINPADLASRGIFKLNEWERWLKGPVEIKVPCDPQACPEPNETDLELKNSVTVSCHAIEGDSTEALLRHYSDWMKLLKGVAWLSRFKSWLADRSGYRATSPLTVGDIRKAEADVVRLIQREAFSDVKTNEFRELRNLNPVVVDSFLRVGGRLTYGNYDDEYKHPIILPKNHPVVDLMIKFYHELNGHVGSAHVLSIIRRKFWIVHGLRAVKRVVWKCLHCRKLHTPLCSQVMAPLPRSRVETGWFPFKYVGVDYFGPFIIKRARCTVKRFGCLFTCLQSRAIHVELAADLTTDGFILSFLRFVGRRGSPEHIYSDNGTNFVGAVKELKGHISKWDQDKISANLMKHDIQWHFNPPEASHRGGIWERMIRSVRQILMAMLKEQNPTEEVLHTLLVRVEGIVNSRPLVPASSDHRDDRALTPNDLLLVKGDSMDITECLVQRYRKQWKQVIHLTSVFWNRWMRSYLPTLQIRTKWSLIKNPVKPGELVLLHVTSLPRNSWPLGIIENVEISEDGLPRTVTVRTVNGSSRRDIRSICRLEGVVQCGCSGAGVDKDCTAFENNRGSDSSIDRNGQLE